MHTSIPLSTNQYMSYMSHTWKWANVYTWAVKLICIKLCQLSH
jgi:hypothetical protein